MKHLLKKTAVVLLAVFICIALFSFKSDNNEKIITELVCERTDIMEGYFCGQINLNDAVRAIKQIEKGRLLEEDIRNMKEFFQTDIEAVSMYEVTGTEITYKDENLVCAVMSILWETHGINGKDKTEEVYSVIMEKSENSFKLVQFF